MPAIRSLGSDRFNKLATIRAISANHGRTGAIKVSAIPDGVPPLPENVDGHAGVKRHRAVSPEPSTAQADSTPVRPPRPSAATPVMPMTPCSRRVAEEDFINEDDLKAMSNPVGVIKQLKRELRKAQRGSQDSSSAALQAVKLELVQAQAALAVARAAQSPSKLAEVEAERTAWSNEKVELEEQVHTAAAAAQRSQAVAETLRDKCQQLQRELSAVQADLAAARAATCEAVAGQQAARDEAAAAVAAWESVDAARRAAVEELLDERGAIRVYSRVRPAASSEKAESSDGTAVVQVPAGAAVTDLTVADVAARSRAVDHGQASSSTGAAQSFSVHRVFPPSADNATVWGELQPLVASVLDGRRVCVFAYGQTGSGKSHTMLNDSQEDAGMIPRATDLVFTRAAAMREHGWTVTVRASMVEIYKEQLRDLLGYSKSAALELRHGAGKSSGELAVSGLTRHELSDRDSLPTLLERAARARVVGSTDMNAVSSRSHAVFTLGITAERDGERRAGVLNLIDLAGSERLSRSGAVGDRAAETAAINASLSALGKVIAALASGAKHVPFRDSKLTRLLEPCLAPGSGGRVAMIANISPALASSHETLCTMRFAAAAAGVSTKAGARSGSVARSAARK